MAAMAEDRTWHGLYKLVTRPGPFAPDFFEPTPENVARVEEDARILVVGAGGLGCEILKNLALSGFRDIEVIDLDTIDISNLNRQFLFRRKHVGRSKAEVAASVVMEKFPQVKVKWHMKKIQDFPRTWYKKFNVVVAGLDNVAARQWLNRTLNELVTYDEDGEAEFESSIPLIDGGTEGFRGQARVFFPKLTSCFECSIGSMPQQTHYHQCTIATTPRIPEHCIQYVYEIMWPLLEDFRSVDEYKLYQPKDTNDNFTPNKIALDKDNPNHLSWIYHRSCERAAQFGIQGVTYKLVMQVVKNIIPAVASTNAVIAAACVNEAVKIVTRSSQFLNNFMAYNGVSLYGCALHRYEKLADCPVCQKPLVMVLDPACTVDELRRRLAEEAGWPDVDLGTTSATVYIANMHDHWKANLQKPVSAFVGSNQQLMLTAKPKRVGTCVVVFREVQ